MKTLLTRSISGILFVSLVVFCLLGDKGLLIALFGLISGIGLYEFHLLFSSKEKFNYPVLLSSLIGVIGFIVLIYPWFNLLASDYNRFLHSVIHLLIFIIIIGFFQFIYNSKQFASNTLLMVKGLIYVVVPLFLGAVMHFEDKSNFPILLGLFLLVWTNDTFAYISGNLFGKHKLIERISPNKTWEGFFGGFLITILVGYLVDFYFFKGDFYWIIAAIIVSPAAVIGDLYESYLKRKNKVKDTGNIMPGHGGILDRFDAMFFAIPFFYIWYIVFT